jgi:3-hydroxyacyl-[acyl-carrier-protein] dehydratase
VRYVLVDRILSLTPHQHLRALKNVTATDEAAVSAGAGMPHLPAAMLLESMAQAAGLLVIASSATAVQPVLAKVQAFAMSSLARPGDRIVVDASLDDLRPEGARLRVTAGVDERTIASAVVLLALVGIDAPDEQQLLTARLAALFPAWFPRVTAEAAL